MTHPLRVAENCTTHPLHKAQNLMTHPLSAPAHPPPILFDQSLITVKLEKKTAKVRLSFAAYTAYHTVIEIFRRARLSFL